MSYSNTYQRAKSIKEKNNRIVGTAGWYRNKYPSMNFGKRITRNTLTFTQPKYVSKNTFNEDAYKRGWSFNSDIGRWVHPNYKNKTFGSIVTSRNKLVPYCAGDDVEGLAFNYKLSGCGQRMEIFQNKWLTEEFDTRRGKRRIKWEKKKENRRLAIKMINGEDFDMETHMDDEE